MWLAVARQVEGRQLGSRELLEHSLLLLPILEIRNGDRIFESSLRRITLPQSNEPIRIVIRQRLNDDGIQRAENHGICADSESESDHNQQRESRMLPQRPSGIEKITPECFQKLGHGGVLYTVRWIYRPPF